METEIQVGETGDFEVFLDGAPVFSKRSEDRFPNPGEVEKIVGALAGKK